MRILFRTMFVLAVAALTAVAGVGTASADGPDTDPRVAKAIELQAWVPIDVGDRGHRAAFVRCALTQLGYYNNCNPTGTNGAVYLNDMVAAVKRFQAAVFVDVDANGTVTGETWSEIRHRTGVVGFGDGRRSLVRGVQYAMKVLQSPSLVVDGYYEGATRAAVEAFQRRKRIDVDGYFGPQTFRAAMAEGAEQRFTPGL
ncbi:peptidoglycan-binding domain-containing protein [Actinomadura algeriensis]|uniref:Peptidoglycan hydrolase-like protein with peptidoglycan-binding domain n=1 Tax=Actinomadura algeriensis TaxID=1679523 RepID=A0ABR9K592_9ACTN|nr:peptidoglycan-binding protein [Actinomadura algeriensis]MBE1538007.1 peptidoglycan hydrolase-like protein with peptidoglycan-binding domain [Actinomadura algeriensis]